MRECVSGGMSECVSGGMSECVSKCVSEGDVHIYQGSMLTVRVDKVGHKDQ